MPVAALIGFLKTLRCVQIGARYLRQCQRILRLRQLERILLVHLHRRESGGLALQSVNAPGNSS